jgi:hypothetical protein
MKSPLKPAQRWLHRPQQTNRDALVVGFVGVAMTAAAVYALRKLLELVKVVDFTSSLPIWVASLIGGSTLGLGLLLGRGTTRGLQERAVSLNEEVKRLQARTSELDAYQTYSEHLREAIADLRRVISGQLPSFSVQDFIEKGLFEPAQSLLMREGTRGDVRFSVLHLDGEDFVMGDEDGTFPALGHSLEARQNFRLPIAGSFSELPLRQGRVYASANLSTDDRFRRHPRARPGREYESIVSVPLHIEEDVDGVVNVIATHQNAFNAVDRTYITLLGSLIDLARGAARSPTTTKMLDKRDDPPDGAPNASG